MATPSDTKFEIQQTDYSWLDCYADVQSNITANKIGLYIDPDVVPSFPDVGKMTVDMVNTSGNYTPAANGIGTGRIDNNRRCRIRYSGKNNGKALQAIVNGAGGSGGTVDTAAGTASVYQVGNTPRHQVSQSFKATLPGVLTSFIIYTTSNPIRSALWELHNYDTSQNGNIGTTILASGNVNNALSGLQTTTVTSGPYLVPNVEYILVMKWPTGFTDGVNFLGSASSTYANGTLQTSNDDGVTWTDTLADLNLKIVTSGDAVYTSQTVTTATSIADVWTLQWDARAQFDSQYNYELVNIVTSGETGAQTLYTYTNKWVTYTLTFTATATGTTIAPRFAPQLAGSNNSVAVEYRNITLKKGAGSNVLVNGDFSSGAISPWAATNAGSTTLADTVINDYYIVFDGRIEDIHPSAQLSNVSPITTLDLVDHVDRVKSQLATLPLQKTFTCDSLADLALAQLPSGTLNTTLPGTVTDPGRSTFPIGGDTWVSNRTSVLQIINQGMLSELGGRCWMDRDGTFEVHNRDYIPLRAGATPKLSLADGQSGYQLVLLRSKKKIRNDIVITYHQRVTGAAAGVIGKADNLPIFLPGNGTVSITLTFKDSAGNTIGADSLQTLTPTTDYLVNYYATNDPSYNVSTNDLTTSSYLTVTSTNTASQMVVTFKSSSSAFAGWINFLQVRGLTVTQYNPATIEVSDATSIATYEKQPFTVDLPFQVNQQFITNYANYLLTQFKYPFIEASYFECTNCTVINGVDVMSLEIGDTVSVSDSRNGLSSVIHMVTAVEYDWGKDRGNSEPTRIRVYLERMDQAKYWELGVAGFGELGTATYLFI